MYLKINNKDKLEIVELKSFWSRLKGIRFSFEKLDYCIKFPNKKLLNTAFNCQRIDIVMTGKNDKILYIYQDVKPEKYFLPKFKVEDMYFLPAGAAKALKVGESLPIKK